MRKGKKDDNKEPLPEEEAAPLEEELLDTTTVEALMQNEQKRQSEEQEDYKQKYLRQLAETENMRKRLQGEKHEMLSFAVGNALGEFLGPLDQLENALGFADQMSDEVKNWAHGFQMILTQFKEVLNSHGVNGFDSLGKTFDPHYHEAVEVVETDEAEENTITAELLKGYIHGKRVLRAARVKVAKKKEPAKKDEEQSET